MTDELRDSVFEMPSASRSLRLVFGMAIFLGAFLLFAAEPMAAKRLLPALGGSSAVWITCLVFFQTVLLLGYLYAHGLGRLRSAGMAGVLHTALLAIAAAMLAVVALPDLSHAAGHPLTAIFQALTVTIGLPFFLLASTSPLLQLWLAREAGSGKSFMRAMRWWRSAISTERCG